jgi:hypothetical protein
MPDACGRRARLADDARLSASGLRKRRLAAIVAAADPLPEALRIEERAAALGLGTCVLVSLSGDAAEMTEEGVVIEVVAPGDRPRSKRVETPDSLRAPLTRYVVHCRWRRLLLRRAGELVVDPRDASMAW